MILIAKGTKQDKPTSSGNIMVACANTAIKDGRMILILSAIYGINGRMDGNSIPSQELKDNATPVQRGES